MPNLFTVSGYKIYFWAGDGDEPIHVHVSKGKPTSETTKIWLTKGGGCVLASGGDKIPKRDLDKLMKVISAQFFYICAQWQEFFVVDKIRFYC